MSDNLALWNSVSETDPAFCKDFRSKSGFRGTAINPMYQVRRATELWGPCGVRWGFNVASEQIVDTVPIFNKDGKQGVEKIHTALVTVWYYATNDSLDKSYVTQSGATTVCGVDAMGNFWSNEEFRKQSVTDALTKALSLLGFSANIYLGIDGFKDNKYTNNPAVKDQPHQDQPKAQQTQPATTVRDIEASFAAATKAISAAKNKTELARIQAHYQRKESGFSAAKIKELDDALALRIGSFKQDMTA